MSEPTPAARRSPNRDRLRAGFQKLNFSNERRIVGPAELIGLTGAVFILVLVVVSYLYFLLPANTRLDELMSERSLLQSQLRDLKGVVSQGESTEASVEKITQSLDEFESNHLTTADDLVLGDVTCLHFDQLRAVQFPARITCDQRVPLPGRRAEDRAAVDWLIAV